MRRQLVTPFQRRAPWRISRFRDAWKLSQAALSAEVPTAPMDCVTPNSLHRSANSFDVYWAPWSLWKIARSRLPRVAAAARSASATSSVRIWSAIDHPTTRREKQSMTVAR
ncbi:hypothetical protein C7C46_31430 [Streptomyces tateyamensis]|uniref:Uncharacterized protein n=1 Tax=Streptomyces tateyamensis TaxID=565073 RepID=A0A2V4NTE3_9ACTN|nr:hypothetical protein C7C46_31430 [Streptomyces tateyamensis]